MKIYIILKIIQEKKIWKFYKKNLEKKIMIKEKKIQNKQ